MNEVDWREQERQKLLPLHSFIATKRECYGKYDEFHNFCKNICSSRKTCRNLSIAKQ